MTPPSSMLAPGTNIGLPWNNLTPRLREDHKKKPRCIEGGPFRGQRGTTHECEGTQLFDRDACAAEAARRNLAMHNKEVNAKLLPETLLTGTFKLRYMSATSGLVKLLLLPFYQLFVSYYQEIIDQRRREKLYREASHHMKLDDKINQHDQLLRYKREKKQGQKANFSGYHYQVRCRGTGRFEEHLALKTLSLNRMTGCHQQG